MLVTPKNVTLLSSFILLVSTFSAWGYQAEKVMSGLAVPWGMAFIDENHLLVTERNGNIVWIDLTTQTKKQLLHVPDVYARGQGGLLDIKHSPFNNNVFYFTYSKQSGRQAATALAQLTIDDSHHLSEWHDLLVTQSWADRNYHFGSRITFDEHYLYLSVGERGLRHNAQDLSNHAGSILRLYPDGSVPDDNPFAGQPNARAEIWSYGHRNPQGLFFDRATGQLWEVEHGPRGGDEINRIQKGLNYGWPVTSHGREYISPAKVGESEYAEGIEPPTLVYIPSIAPGSMLLYRGTRYPALHGKLLISALKLTHINVVTIDTQQNRLTESERLFNELSERIRNIVLSPDGWIYFSTDSGHVYRIVNESGSSVNG